MTVTRRYTGAGPVTAAALGGERVVESIAASIYTEWNVRNILVWENERSGVQHWREECRAWRRADHGKSSLIPREVGLSKPCGVCARIEAKEREREREEEEREHRHAELLAIQPRHLVALPAADD